MAEHDFHTILIANRGEIALRIIDTARRMDYRTVAVYSDADRGAPHTRAADAAVHIGASQPAASYLNIPALIDAALRAGAGAVHPGYGFLAENAEFCQACIDAGLVFIGPTPQAIEAMGHKAGAKRLMMDAGVPCVPGYQGQDQSDAGLQEALKDIGFPVMIKAVAGGGGRGMRRVDAAGDFLQALHSARSEAQHAFGNGDLILERAIVDPRHIEIQVFADMQGNVVSLGERDCSVQRRHQKVIEEAPSPAVSPELRRRMGEVAVAAARSIGYRGAGTLEFLLDQSGQFYFMEMNTRLQVEHAVTEAVVGVDLVEWQLRVARGEALPLSQQEVTARFEAGGHAIEVRLCAEDTVQEFLPQSGRVAYWQAPLGIRAEHALESGITISPYYDSMIGKLVAHGRDRMDALRALGRALDQCVLLGVKSNRRFLRQCLLHPAFIAGHATTGFIEAFFPPARRAENLDSTAQELALCVAACLAMHKRAAQAGARYPDELRGWSSSAPYPRPYHIVLDGAEHRLDVTRRDSGFLQVRRDGVSSLVRVGDTGAQASSFDIDGCTYRVVHAVDGASLYFMLDGVEHVVQDITYRQAGRNRQGGGDGRVMAPLNGRVVAIEAVAGATVAAGQLLLVIEAMKMEHRVTAPHDGVVGGVFAVVGDQVMPGRVLVEITAQA